MERIKPMTRCIVGICLMILMTGVICVAAPSIRQIAGQADVGTVEVHGLSAGEFDAGIWKAGTLNILPDVRHPMIEPLKSGVFRNIYAPAAVETPNGWRLFYGAWDGIETGHDRIYSVETTDFLDFSNRHTVIHDGEFVHVCNVSALRLPSGEFRLMCTTFPNGDNLNKPALFTSPDGRTWNGSPAPYPAKKSDLVEIQGYDKFENADINGMNVIFYDDGVYRLYFNNFRDFGKVFRASSKDGRSFEFDGQALAKGACVNDVKKFTAGAKPWYLMGLHMNGDTLWYALSNDGLHFEPAQDLIKNQGAADRYIVAIGWVTRGNRLLGFVYGAGEVPGLNRNRLFARWLQKKIAFVGEDGTRYEARNALGPDRAIIEVPKDGQIKGHFVVYGEDGSTVVLENAPATLMSGAVFVLE